MDVGLTCACLPAFPTLIDRFFPEGLSLRSYFSHFKSYFFTSRGSQTTSQLTSSQSRKDPAHNDDRGADGTYTPLKDGIPGGYNDINDRAPLARDTRCDTSQHRREQSTKTMSRSEGSETWGLQNEVRFVPEADVERDFAMQNLKR